jgi:hypothetical protein
VNRPVIEPVTVASSLIRRLRCHLPSHADKSPSVDQLDAVVCGYIRGFSGEAGRGDNHAPLGVVNLDSTYESLYLR